MKDVLMVERDNHRQETQITTKQEQSTQRKRALQVLMDCGVNRLPVQIGTLCRKYGITVALGAPCNAESHTVVIDRKGTSGHVSFAAACRFGEVLNKITGGNVQGADKAFPKCPNRSLCCMTWGWGTRRSRSC